MRVGAVTSVVSATRSYDPMILARAAIRDSDTRADVMMPASCAVARSLSAIGVPSDGGSTVLRAGFR